MKSMATEETRGEFLEPQNHCRRTREMTELTAYLPKWGRVEYEGKGCFSHLAFDAVGNCKFDLSMVPSLVK